MAKTQNERAVIDLVINGQSAKTTLKEVSLEVTRTRSALLKMKEADDPKGYAERLAHMHKLIDAQRQMKARIDDTSTAWGRFKKESAQVMTGVVGGNIATAGLQALAGAIPAMVDKTMKLKDAFADIEKATGLSAKGVEALNKELKNIDTRTTNKELRDIAVAGGQLGVANDQLVDFVKNTDMAVVALGDEFTGGVEQVAKEIGGLGKLFKETREQEIGTNINQIGSALNELGAAGAATSPVVAEFATRIGQLGGLAPTISETLGLGAALQELGLTSEIASSGLSGLLLTAASKSELFAQQLRMSKTEMEALMNRSPNEFLMQLAKSFEGLSATQVAQRLKELKVESQESIKVMSLLADQTDFVKEKQDLASKAMAEGTSLTDEFSKKNHQLARDLKELNEWFNSLLSSPAIQEFLMSAIHNAVSFIKVLPQLGQWLSQNREWFGLMAASLLAYNGVLIKTTLATAAQTAAELYRKAAYEISFRWLVIQTAASKAYSLATGVLTGQVTLQTAAVTLARSAWAGLSAVMLANPVGVIVAAMTALAYAVKLYSDNTEAALRIEREKIALQRDMQLLTERHTHLLEQFNEQLQDYNSMSEAEQANLVKNIAMARLDVESKLSQMKVRQKHLEMLALEPSLWEKVWAAMKSGGSAAAYAQAMTEQGVANVQSVREQFKSQTAEIEAELKNYDKIFKQIQRNEKPTGTAGGGSLPTIKDPEAAKQKRKTEADREKAEVKRNAEELEKLLADSRKRTMGEEESDYDKEVAAFATKYSRMYELAVNNQEKIDEVRRLSLLEFAEIDQKREEKQAEADRKQATEDNKTGFNSAMNLADQSRADAQSGIDRQEGFAGESDVRMQELEADQMYLTQKLLLEQTFAQDSADTQRQLTENWNAQVKLRASTEKQYAEQMKQAEWALQDAKRAAMSEGIGVLKGFLKQGTIAYKAAIVGQKAFAIAQVIVDMNREIAQIYANPTWSLLPDGGLALKTSNATAAKVRAGVSIASIAAQGIQEVAAKADGGYTSLQELYGSPSGFVNSPTLFNQGRRSYIAGEAGREFVINNRALQNPVVADFARIMDVVQRTGNFGLLQQQSRPSSLEGSIAMPAPTNNTAGVDLTPLLLEMQAMRNELKEQGNKSVDFNYHAFEDYRDRVDFIRTVTSG